MEIQRETRPLLQELSLLIQKLPPEVFTASIPVLNGQTIGKHIRHILEFYECLCHWKSGTPLDYSVRKRDVGLECQPQKALEKCTDLFPLLDDLSVVDRMWVFPDVSNPDPEPVESTIGRELMYLFDHTMHHLAMIQMALKTSFPEIAVPKKLGMAHSTRRQMPNTTHQI